MKIHFIKLTSITFLLLGVIFIICSSAQLIDDNDYAIENHIRYDDYTYDDSIKTVLLFNTRNEMSYPIISLSGNETIKLSFDDLRRENSIYNYTIVHCNANWSPSDLEQNEYIEGFFEDELFDFEYSNNTDLYYTHYNATIPNENMKPTKSGNYIIMVYKVNDKEHPILTKRFMVYENRVSISMDIKRATDVNESYFRQEVDFKINHNGYDIKDPFGRLNVVLMQNYRWDNAITGLKPKFIKDTELNYDFNNSENVFDANNEFRYFDLKSIRYQTIRVKRIQFEAHDKLTHAYLLDDESRSFKQYYSQTDLNGNFLIKRNEGENSETEAEYIKVHFKLPYYPPLTNGNLYLFGKFSDWKFKKELKLDYDTLNQNYYKEVLLKQGYYDYLYCFVKDGSKNVGDISVVEGSHYETKNEYSILVYYRGLNDDYDRLVGFSSASN
ncbi:MAG: DUF5103 domain-containing protein, partial [Flavobacteriales bacterium]|nr:DUF5103 domain-containing protein [Flavobacteriales bacterium]